MTTYTFCDREEVQEHVKAAPIQNILAQHRKRFVIQTERSGTIVLKHLTYRMKRNIDAMKEFRYPDCKKHEDELKILAPLVISGEAGDEQIKRAGEIMAEIKPSIDMYMMGVVEYPFLASMDEVDALIESLTEEEKEVLLEAFSILSSHAPDAVNVEYLEMADRFKVQVIDKDLLDNITMQQYEILHRILKEEADALRKAYRKAGVDI
ncbi:MAG: hypothetical protein FWD92_03440 [Methanomassiliicoccaceae archaeon]|nr:hypothetical protein [Methanomassiliicoccaceae archaeon]